MENQTPPQIPANPFNTGSPVDPNDFVGRSNELESFRQKLRQTQLGSLASMAVAGVYGIGKTSFLHKCKVIAEEYNSLVILFNLNEMDDFSRESLSNMLIDRLREKVREEIILKRISEDVWAVLKKIRITIASQVEIEASDTNKSYPTLQSALLSTWNTLKNHRTCIVFLIDEARILEKNRADLILYLRAVLEQLQTTKTPIMVVPAGKLTITGPSGSGFSPLVRTFPPSILENFTKQENASFIKKKLGSVNIKIADALIDRIYDTTEGHPFVLSAYMSAAYLKLAPGETELKKEHFDATDENFVRKDLSQFFARFYDQASKGSKAILRAIAKRGGELTLNQLTTELKKEANELSPYLAKLTQDGAILRIDRGRYKLFHKLLIPYISS